MRADLLGRHPGLQPDLGARPGPLDPVEQGAGEDRRHDLAVGAGAQLARDHRLVVLLDLGQGLTNHTQLAKEHARHRPLFAGGIRARIDRAGFELRRHPALVLGFEADDASIDQRQALGDAGLQPAVFGRGHRRDRGVHFFAGREWDRSGKLTFVVGCLDLGDCGHGSPP